MPLINQDKVQLTLMPPVNKGKVQEMPPIDKGKGRLVPSIDDKVQVMNPINEDKVQLFTYKVLRVVPQGIEELSRARLHGRFGDERPSIGIIATAL